MSRGGWFNISLARKLGLLFGTAVLLVIAATLTFPWYQMKGLNEQAMLLAARQVAIAAERSVDLYTPDWYLAQTELNDRWPTLARELDLPPTPPLLAVVDRSRIPNGPPLGGGFHAEALEFFSRHPDRQYFWRIQDDGSIFRLAMAVRGRATDPYPQALLGLVDVRQPVTLHLGAWNIFVTALAGASGAVLAIFVFYLVTQRLVLRQVDALREVTERVTTTGDVTVRAEIRSGDEFQKLSDAFNRMLANIRQAEEEQRKINRSLDVRLEELAQLNVNLYEANRVKNDFLANVSHELRTPLVSIIGFAELLRDAFPGGNTDPARLKRYAENILTSGRSLLEIINDLLDLAKIEAGKMDLHVVDFDPGELCSDLIDFVRPLADKRQQALSLDAEADLPRCRSDSGKIKQILYNLLSNAIKFTPTGGRVALRVARDGAERILLEVSDSGPGIPEEKQTQIFEKFRQLDSSRTREYEGTGLGLAITRELVQILGGAIRLYSVPGEGATFTVSLPVAMAEPAARVPAARPA